MPKPANSPGTPGHRQASKSKHTPIKRIVNQLALGAKPSQVAKSVNVSRQAISQILKRYGIERNLVESFKENRADIFAGIQETVAHSLTEADIKDASLRDRTVLLGVLFDKERLERGQSTQNIATIMASTVIEAGKQWAVPIASPTQGTTLDGQVCDNAAVIEAQCVEIPPKLPQNGGA